jgi:hypothetical protein
MTADAVIENRFSIVCKLNISDVVLGANQSSQLRQEGRTGEGRNDYYENPRFLHAASTPLPITRNLTISATAI